MSIQARTQRPRGGIGRGAAARSGRRGREGGTAAAAPRPPHTLPLAHTAGGGTGGEEPRLALPQPVKPRAPRPCLLRAPPLPRSAGAARQAPVRRTALPATPRRSPLPPAERLVRSVFAAVEPVGQRREGEGATTSARKREEEEREV